MVIVLLIFAAIVVCIVAIIGAFVLLFIDCKVNEENEIIILDKMVDVKIINNSGYDMPAYAKPGDSGLDLKAKMEYPVRLLPLSRKTIYTGIHIALPEGYEAQVRGKSGRTASGLCVPTGTVDNGFRGEIGVTVFNLSQEPITINPGEKIAQLVIAPVAHANLIAVDVLDETERGVNGFGSTGLE